MFIDRARERVWFSNDGSGNDGSLFNVTTWRWRPGTEPTEPRGVLTAGHVLAWQAAALGAIATGVSRRRVIVGSWDNGAVCFDDATRSSAWTPIDEREFNELSVVHVARADPNVVYVRNNAGDLFMRTTAAASSATCGQIPWEAIEHGVSSTFFTPNMVATHPLDASRVYFAAKEKVVVGFDFGSTPFDDPTPPGRRSSRSWATAIEVDADGTIYLGTLDDGVFLSGSGGWIPFGFNDGTAGTVWSIAIAETNPRTVWAATTAGLYRRRLDETDWAFADGGGGYVIGDVEVDPSCPSRVYAAFGRAAHLGQHRGGLLFSNDHGQGWTSLTSGLPVHQAPVADVEVDRSLPQHVYVASYGRGFWHYDWGEALPSCAP